MIENIGFVPMHVGQGGSSSPVGLVIFFVIGLLGGAHCIGMCGPLVTMYSDRLAHSQSARDEVLTPYAVRQHALFNGGRTVSYAVLGGIFGVAGGIFFDVSSVGTNIEPAVRAVMGVIVGVVILGVGFRYVLGDYGSHGVIDISFVAGLFGRIAPRMDSWVTGPGIVGLGVIHGLLPCPLLYPAFLFVFSQGDPVGGVIALGLLGLGTFPTLFLYGTIIQSVSSTHRARLHRALGVAFLILGWMPLAHGLGLFGVYVPHVEVPIYQPLSAIQLVF